MTFELSSYDQAVSAICYALIEQLTTQAIWAALTVSQSGEELDTAICASIRLKEIGEIAAHRLRKT